jgi:hypothetical protein
VDRRAVLGRDLENDERGDMVEVAGGESNVPRGDDPELAS